MLKAVFIGLVAVLLLLAVFLLAGWDWGALLLFSAAILGGISYLIFAPGKKVSCPKCAASVNAKMRWYHILGMFVWLSSKIGCLFFLVFFLPRRCRCQHCGNRFWASMLDKKSHTYTHTHYIIYELADQGDAKAQYDLGLLKAKNQGVEKDFKEAVKWYRKAAEQGDDDAQYNLGVMYENGQGVEKDDKKAVKWYRKAAEQGDEDAKVALKELSQ